MNSPYNPLTQQIQATHPNAQTAPTFTPAQYPNFSNTDAPAVQALTQYLISTDKDLQKHGMQREHLTAIYRYCDKNGNLLYFKPRFDKDGKKWIKPCWYDGNRFYLGEPKDRYNTKAKPLYNLPQLATLPQTQIVYFVEGEKCADSLTSLGIFALTAGASSSTSTTDLTPLTGYNVRLWRDYDGAGIKWLNELTSALDALKIAYDVIDVETLAKTEPLQSSDDASDYIQRRYSTGVPIDDARAQIYALPVMSADAYRQQQQANTPATAKKTANTDDGDKWGKLIPFDEVQNIETPFPVNAFPPLLAQVVEKVAYYQQVPLSMAGFSVLGAISHIGQAYVNAPYNNGTYNPASLFLLVQAESGSGKTQTLKLTHKAIIDHERKEHELYREDKRAYDNELASLTKKEIKAFHEQNHKPRDPRNMFGSGSVQKVMQGFTDGNYLNASYTADEGANLLEGASLKANTAGSSIGAICNIYSSGVAERHLINNAGETKVGNVRLTLFLSGQAVVIKPALNDIRLSDQGLLPRCLLACPADNRGYRQLITESALNDEVLVNYWKKCTRFLESMPADNERELLAWTAPALQVFNDYWNKVEKSQRKGGIDHNARAYASRMAENASRVASLFAWFNGKHAIDVQEIQGAIAIIEYSAKERRRYNEISIDITDAEKLLQWLIKKAKKNKQSSFYYSYLQTHAPKALSEKQTLENALILLSDYNYIFLDTQNTSKKPKRVIELNPVLLKDA